MEQTQKRFWRRKAGYLVIGSVLVITAILVQKYISLPFDTANRFHELLRNEQFNDARAMVEPSGQDKIPSRYWEQFRGKPPVLLTAPTPLTFINGRMAIKPVIFDHDHFLSIRFEVIGTRLRVAEFEGRQLD